MANRVQNGSPLSADPSLLDQAWQAMFGRNGLFGPNCKSVNDYRHYDYDHCEGEQMVADHVLFLRDHR